MSLDQAIVVGICAASRSRVVSGRTVLVRYWIHGPEQPLSQMGERSSQEGTGRIPQLFLAACWSQAVDDWLVGEVLVPD